MKINYTCQHCDEHIDTIEVDKVDEARFGFDCLTGEERQDIIKFDALTNTMHVKSLCDQCIEALGLADERPAIQGQQYLH